MENNNIKKDENLQENTVEKIVNSEEVADLDNVTDDAATKETETTEVAEEITEEAAEETTEETAKEALTDQDLADEEGEIQEFDDATADVAFEEEVYLTEEELAQIEAQKKQRRKRNNIILAAVAAVVAVVVWFVCYTEGVGSSTIVNQPGVSNAQEDASVWDILKPDNIRYENPIVSIFDKITGKNADAVMKVNGIAVDKDVFGFATNSSAINSVYSLMQTGMIQDVNDFDWNATNEEMKLSYLEFAKSMAVETLVPIYATIAEGEKRGVEFTDEDEKQISDWIDTQKEAYGAEFEKVLKNSGYADEDTLYQIQKIQLYMQKVYEDIEKDPSKYITNSVKEKLADDKVTVKHILIGFESDEGGNVSDENKAKAKKIAEEALAKVKAGGDFDQLIKEYNTDPGVTDEGYTFAQDGSMVKEFEDASFALEIGETSGIVETTYGYHIIKRLERYITADDYITLLQQTAPVNIKKGVFNDIKVTIDLNYFFAPQTTQTPAEEPAE